MSFNLLAMQQGLLARLVDAGIPDAVLGAFDQIDVTDESGKTFAAQIAFLSLDPSGQAGRSAAHAAAWSFDLLVDTARASDAEKQAAMTLFSDAMAALVGWEIQPGAQLRISEGRKTGFDGRVVGISFGFTVPVYLAG